MPPSIFYFLPGNPAPSGGVFTLLAHISACNELGLAAYGVHPGTAVPPAWEACRVPLLSREQPLPIRPGDAVVLPEEGSTPFSLVRRLPPGVRAYVFCQNHTLIFFGLERAREWSQCGFDGVFCCSKAVADVVGRLMGRTDVPVIPPVVDPALFGVREKTLQIAFMPRKRRFESTYIRNLFQRLYPDLAGIPWIALDNIPRREVARHLGESAVFLALGRFEGLGLPPLEAMSCGCLVAGFHGWGGQEFARPDNGLWCTEDDLVECTLALGRAVSLVATGDPRGALMQRAGRETAAAYSPQALRLALAAFWQRELAPRVACGTPTAEYAGLAALHQAGNHVELEARARRLVERFPEDGRGWQMLGLALVMLQRPLEALEALDRAVALLPEAAEPLAVRGVALRRLGRFPEAEAAYRRGIALCPHLPSLHDSLGNVLLDMGHLKAAEAAYRQALELRPASANTLCNLGMLLHKDGRVAEAAAAYGQALELEPHNAHCRMELAHRLRHLCDWPGLDRILGPGHRLQARPEDLVDPFVLLCEDTDAASQLAFTQAFTAAKTAAATEARPQSGPPLTRPNGRLRLGYLSMDFREHPVGRLMAGLPAAHDRSRFEVFAYSYGPDDGSPLRKRFERDFDMFREARGLSSAQIAAQIAADGVDILVDLAGHTGNARPEILAMRPAPVQVHYLGYPGTLGGNLADYLVADPVIIPAGQEAFYAERLVRLPFCYQINEPYQPIPPGDGGREAWGLPADAFVFCCLNAQYKLTPRLFALWLELLTAVPGSVLWLLVQGETARGNLRRTAAAAGLSPDRLVFADRAPHAVHLARHQAADLFLDTFPVNAHTTASDSLRAGLPLLTLRGNTFVSRVAASILLAMGLPELVADSEAAYRAIALDLARQPEALAAVRGRLLVNAAGSPLFDTIRTTRALEYAYGEMWRRHVRGEGPAAIDVPAATGVATGC